MTISTTYRFTAPTGTALYQSSVVGAKISELKASGDLISNTTTVLSDTEKTVTLVWKDEAARTSFRSWIEASGEELNLTAYNSSNSISITEL